MEKAKKVVAVIGSPRTEGSSTKVAQKIIEGAKEAGCEVVVYRINDMNVRGCQNCRYCKENGVDCILEDDLKPYWKDLHECDALILSACNYASQVCGPMITFMDRHYCILDKNNQTRVEPGRIKLVGVFAQGGPVMAGTQADRNYDWFLGDFQNRKMVLTDKIVVSRATDLSPEGEVMTRALELGRSL